MILATFAFSSRSSSRSSPTLPIHPSSEPTSPSLGPRSGRSPTHWHSTPRSLLGGVSGGTGAARRRGIPVVHQYFVGQTSSRHETRQKPVFFTSRRGSSFFFISGGGCWAKIGFGDRNWTSLCSQFILIVLLCYFF